MTYAITYVLIHQIIFRFYLLKYILYFFKYSCTNIFHRRSLYTFYSPTVWCLLWIQELNHKNKNTWFLSPLYSMYYCITLDRVVTKSDYISCQTWEIPNTFKYTRLGHWDFMRYYVKDVFEHKGVPKCDIIPCSYIVPKLHYYMPYSYFKDPISSLLGFLSYK